MNNEQIQLSSEDSRVLRLLGDSFTHIRGICSRWDDSGLSDKEKLELINKIADVSHNLPHVLAQGGSNSNLAFLMHSVSELRELIGSKEYPKKAQHPKTT